MSYQTGHVFSDGHKDKLKIFEYLHGGVTPRGVEDIVPFFFGQFTISILVSLVKHLANLNQFEISGNI